jgi:hypothetical protein
MGPRESGRAGGAWRVTNWPDSAILHREHILPAQRGHEGNLDSVGDDGVAVARLGEKRRRVAGVEEHSARLLRVRRGDFRDVGAGNSSGSTATLQARRNRANS